MNINLLGQGKDVQLDLQKKTGRDCVGTTQSSGMQHGPLSTRTVRGIPHTGAEILNSCM